MSSAKQSNLHLNRFLRQIECGGEAKHPKQKVTARHKLRLISRERDRKSGTLPFPNYGKSKNVLFCFFLVTSRLYPYQFLFYLFKRLFVQLVNA